MRYFYSSAALAAYATLTLAAPAADLASRSEFRVKQVEHGKVFKNGALHVQKAYAKYGKVAPESVQRAAAAAQQGSVTATPEQFDSEYLCPVTVGNNQLNLDFDTGSSDLWVFSTVSPSADTPGHSVYNTATGSRISGATYNVQYGDGSGTQGIVFADKVVVGGVTATRQAVEAATSISSGFIQDTDVDGLLGLAFSSINTVQPQQQLTFFDSVKPSLSQALFTADLKKGAPGEYTFGFIDTSKFVGSIVFTPVDNSQGFWQFTAGGFGVGSAAPSGSIGSSIADTGTTLLFLPDKVINAYYSQVSGAKNSATQGGVVFPCSTKLPNLNIAIGGHTFVVPGADLNFAPTNNAGTQCFGGLQSSDGIGLNIFGDIFLKSVYAVFDETTGSPRLGFAEQ